MSPGAVRTEFIEASKIDFGDVMKYVPFLEPDDVTEAIIYALSTKPHVQVWQKMYKPHFI